MGVVLPANDGDCLWSFVGGTKHEGFLEVFEYSCELRVRSYFIGAVRYPVGKVRTRGVDEFEEFRLHGLGEVSADLGDSFFERSKDPRGVRGESEFRTSLEKLAGRLGVVVVKGFEDVLCLAHNVPVPQETSQRRVVAVCANVLTVQ